ncbi:hypothetical protein [Planktothrix paucivesiculata]|uniref:Uncharacterized protein n=1 Tax=Planktothrix paucivesiculata PCC 9631 TaxID=671071 RepID=A0A7Z9BNM8_9CYAN|nr:hypothetical protein [Planktothrix paucivesiculata]VXD16746.1 hypothetical protein PL9631_250048 [Planktothrix paucivesiculata PCC 9631]
MSGRKFNSSEKQWRDVLGILKVQGDSLDTVYLNNQAKSLDLVEDLNRALIEAGLEEISAKTSVFNSELG